MKRSVFGVAFLCGIALGCGVPVCSSPSAAGDRLLNSATASDESISEKKDRRLTPERSRPTVTPDKGIDESESAGKHPAETLTPPDKESVVKPADKKAGSKAKAFSGRAEEDRPWIIKTGKEHKPDIPKKKERPLKWANEAQQVKCDTYLTELRKSLGKARTSSVRGDTCATAKHAKLFLDKADQCKKECPDGFLESKGYSEKVMQNVSVLLELGKKACLGATNSTRTQKTDTRKD